MDLFNDNIERVVEAGLVKYWVKRNVERGRALMSQDRIWRPHRALSFDNLSGAFYVLALGLLIAAIVLMAEIIYEYFRTLLLLEGHNNHRNIVAIIN